MAKYMFEFSYTAEGIKGVLKEGGSGRKKATSTLLESLGGKMESYYFTFGAADGFLIAELPDAASAAAASMIASSSGAVRVKTTVLITPEEMDAAGKKQANYRPPGA
jgi:uncharacterized protein with GYD domain